MRYVSELIKRIGDYPSVYIFGARIVAREVAGVLMGEPYEVCINSFIVSDLHDNPSSVLGIPVIKLDDSSEDVRDGLVIVASMEKNLKGILDSLYRRGIFNVLPLTFERDIWSEVRGNAYEIWLGKNNGIRFCDTDEILHCQRDVASTADDLHVYRAISHFDKTLDEKSDAFSWEIPIQVGKALSDISLCDVNDALGDDNISVKNPKFCELTALYWIWKNDDSRYKGLCHYRRHFILSEQQRAALLDSDIDVVLTIPIFNTPSVYDVYAEDHIEQDWIIMTEELQRLAPDYIDVANEVAKGNWYYAYNMFIARREVFDDYCAFLFPILFACEERIGSRQDRYQGRYAGFLAERLMSIYFMAHKEYRIVHCRKHFME